MYLPTFHKITIESRLLAIRRGGRHLPVLAIWGTYLMYHSIYNMVYSDIFPPARGVERRIAE